jgi:hypothetical protein
MASAVQDVEHPERTQRSQYRYLFTAKHHGGGPRDAARWSAQISDDDEFSVFDTADLHEVFDERGWLYVLRGDDEKLRYLGTWSQQLAEFPAADEGQPWHGYPLWPLQELGPENRRGEKLRPSKEVFGRMEKVGLITGRERKRLYKGEHV